MVFSEDSRVKIPCILYLVRLGYRYPQMRLTDTAIRKVKPGEKPVKMFDERGLFLLVTPAGGKWWRFKYRFDNKEKLLSFGVYPDVGLKKARERRDEARKQVAAEIDPRRKPQGTEDGACRPDRKQF